MTYHAPSPALLIAYASALHGDGHRGLADQIAAANLETVRAMRVWTGELLILGNALARGYLGSPVIVAAGKDGEPAPLADAPVQLQRFVRMADAVADGHLGEFRAAWEDVVPHGEDTTLLDLDEPTQVDYAGYVFLAAKVVYAALTAVPAVREALR